jgi:hypothetical protein
MRLQYMDGAVSLQPGGEEEWVGANLNRPLTTGDRIWVDAGGRSELTMATAALRLGSETSLTITNLDDQTAQFELDQGTVELSVRFLNPGEIVEVDTPNFAYTVERPGQYRFDVYPDQDQSWLTVRRGDGEATGQGNGVRVHSGQQFRFSQGQSLYYENSGAPGPDGFDDWCGVRERREVSSQSMRYVAPGTIGYEDLDDNGDWQPMPMYGAVWFPRVDPGWAPYRYGHWAWVSPWGWTWVDDASWGFAPFHYGRWAQIGGRWGWVPGPIESRPVYAPALVAWVGGPSFGVSVGIGAGVGWVPLGWHDPFIPTYHVSPVYARNVNISNSRVVNVTVINNYYNTTNVNVRNTTINNIQYENVKVNGAVTAVPSAAFASGKPIGRAAVVVPPSAVAHVNMTAGSAVVPTKEAVLGGHPPANAPQRMAAPRQVVSKTAPPPRPLSFEQQKPMLEKSGGAPLSPAVRANIRASSPPPPARNVQPAASGNFKQPGAPAAGQPAANQPHTFGSGQPAGGNTGAPKPNQPANTRTESPAWNAPKPPAAAVAPTPATPPKPATPQPAKPAPEMRAAPTPHPAPTPAPEVHVAPTPHAAPTPAPEVHTAPTPHPAPVQNAAPSAQQKKTPPPPPKEDKKGKDKDKKD